MWCRPLFIRPILCAITGQFLAALAQAAVYEVGPSQKLPDIGSVPWEKLVAGDVVRIHWREKPYHEKWVLSCRGTKEKPVTVSGVAGPKGQLPVIDGENASTRPQLDYWGQERGVVKIGGSNGCLLYTSRCV